MGMSYGDQPAISLGVGEPARAQRRAQNFDEYNFAGRLHHNQILGIGIRVYALRNRILGIGLGVALRGCTRTFDWRSYVLGSFR